jgi:hypothetical protein
MVWTAESQIIELKHFASPGLSAGYRGEGDKLSPQQLETLTKLCVIPKPAVTASSDGSMFEIVIISGAGNRTAYVAFGENRIGGRDWLTDPRGMIDVTSLEPFVAMIGDCLDFFPPQLVGAPGMGTKCM